MEVRSDVTMPEMGNFRWLTVGPAGQDHVMIVLMAVPGPPVFDAETAEQVRILLAKGGTSTVFLVTDDCMQAYADLVSRGSSSRRNRRNVPTGSTLGSATPSATTSVSPR